MKLAKYKDKEKILKVARDQHALTYKERPIGLVMDLSTETWQARKEWQEISNVMNRKKYVAENPLSSKSVIQKRRRNKGIPKQNPKEFITPKPALQEILQGIL